MVVNHDGGIGLRDCEGRIRWKMRQRSGERF